MFGFLARPTITAADVIVVAEGKLVMTEEPDEPLVELCEKLGGTQWLTQAR